MVATSTSTPQLPELRFNLPNLSGWEAEVTAVAQRKEPLWLPHTSVQFDRLQAGFACALHMHQPTIPAGVNGEPICNLQHMFEHPHDGDNHNAGTFAWCYSRMGEFIPELVANGCSPRIMLDYSGNLLWGLRQMGRNDVLDSLARITCDRQFTPYVEWLGTMWSHAVVPSTPIPDIKLHIQAWQHHFAAIFGWEALARVKGFSPPEMHLPNHPDTLFEYVKALNDCGYRWLLVQEHSVERPDGSCLHHDDKYVPNRLVARNSRGDSVSIIALIKTQGSDTKLVAQMQPYHEAKGRGRQQLGALSVPSLVTQIADGENGGVMMNEFPRDFPPIWYELRDGGGSIAGLNGTEYLELLEAAGVTESDYPICQAVGQHKIWNLVEPEAATPDAVEAAIAQLKQTDHQFHMDGASWTNDLSWIQGYENVLEPMNQLSSAFHQRWDRQVHEYPQVTRTEEYQQSLIYNLLLQTSCFRYWGQGTWTEYARSLFDKGMEVVGANT